ncbi:nicotinate-nucleotide pyrophosphorylase (carboxylating) [Bacillus mesophilus]|uniref:Probable nicotinate-nucleotide pyrophosphorylase [carboxylating] n=1 Tax=Bacillus mesophilus TaxID=1808955 RepID=A0A6M0Q9P2_9BACI|nr:carboxylating nicotinate-nucleotide diphosphorylase [Bacillus mesophilus]MBM7660674.1 nicotinate-nucleotide pyrophosphorylase (carboxylating) [Bacillus mesophilus]NEY71778.1 carboxylating nicotinate-nucleotide diphosphorylase [Bacillus mesophilus]
MNIIKLREELKRFLIEDIGEQDLTTSSIFPPSQIGEGKVLAKEPGILAGVDVIKECLHLFDPTISVNLYKKDGEVLVPGDIIATVKGPIVALLTGERIILNLLQRMSGIATLTAAAVKALDSDHTKICDTRKTTPGLRMFEKYAVKCGGGSNHRFGLYDGVMIKDNHIAFSGSITKAVNAVRENTGHMIKIEVETESREAVLEAVAAGADVIMFDNRKPPEIAEFVELVPNHIVTEASGGITIDALKDYGQTGVDYISLGLLTHSYKALDISFVTGWKSEGEK